MSHCSSLRQSRAGVLMLLSTSVMALVGSHSALAQAQSAPAASSNAGSAAAEASRDTAVMDSIVVTAQRRAERIVDVPISITSVSGPALESASVSSISSLPQMAPGLRFDYSGAYVQPTIRGVGSALAGPGMNSNIAVYLDGFYIPNALATDFQLLSVENVQVLKGPQGTLFGRNATGGAILITTRDPSFDTTATVRASYARFDRKNVSMYASTGLTDRIAVDVAGYYESGDGFIRNLNTGAKDGKFDKWSVRTKLLFQATDNLDFTLAYGHTDVDDPTAYATSSYDGLSVGSVIPGVPVASGRRETSNGRKAEHRLNGDVVSLTAKADLDFASFTSYTHYRDERSQEVADYDGTAAPIFEPNWRVHDKTFSQEFNLSSQGGGPLSWVLGLYYFDNKNIYPEFNAAIGGAAPVKIFDTKSTTESYAAFADVTYEITDRLSVTGGLRYSIDKQGGMYNVAGGPMAEGDETFRRLTPRAVLRYELDDQSNVYASYNRGYKAGLLPVAAFSLDPVEPEFIDAFEVGYKVSDGPLHFEASAFYYDYKNLQVAAFIGVNAIYRNAASSEIYGADMQLAADLTDNLRLTLGAAYTHADYKAFDNSVAYEQILDPANPMYGLFGTYSVDVSGGVMPRAPRFSGNAGLHYTQDLAAGSLDLSANVYYTTKFYFDSSRQFEQGAYALLNLRAAYTTANERWTFAVYGTNVTDSKYRSQVLPGTYAIQQTYGEPAVVGASIAFKY